MKPKVKVCGVVDPDFATEAARRGVDYVGVIFAERSPRRVDVAKARLVASAAHAAGRMPPPKVVGVFTSGSADEIADVAASVPLDVVQLHGAFDDETVTALKGAGYEVWRLYDPSRRPAVSGEDAVLLDGRDGGRVGGTGRLADWSLVGELVKKGVRVVLAGGLSSENAAAAAETGANVLDFNSGIEISPGVKSVALLDDLLSRL